MGVRDPPFPLRRFESRGWLLHRRRPITTVRMAPDGATYRRPPADREEARRRCERVSRLIVKLRGHGLVAKVPRARLYRVTRHGQCVMSASIALHDHDFPNNYMLAA